MKIFSFQIQESIYETLRKISYIEKRSIAETVRVALNAYLEKGGKSYATTDS